MKDYKIRVNGEVENKEAQGIFKILGGSWSEHVNADHYDKEFLYLTNGVIEYDDLLYEFLAVDECEEITLPQLRDLVVLKRNDREDANVSEENCRYDLYLTESRELYFYHCSKNKWILSNLNGDDDYYESLKPIEKPMKEYLIKSGDGKYLLTRHDSIGAIEIPEGAEIYIDLGFRNHSFYKDNFKLCWCGVSWENTVHNSMNLEHWNNTPVLWKRHTIPEELPFIDDDFKLNIPEELKGRADLLSGRIIIDDEPSVDTYKSEFGIEPPISLNDQYAEIEKVRQSAWQKQEGGSHYKNLKIQPMQYALENKLDYAQANVVKYVTRHKEKNGKEDLLKAIHNLELMIEFYYGGGE